MLSRRGQRVWGRCARCPGRADGRRAVRLDTGLANAVLVGERRKHIGKADIVRFVALLGNLSISEMSVPVGGILETVIPLGREHGLSAYDAAYLDVAVRTGLALATADGPLEGAARKAGIVIWTSRKGGKGKR